MLILILAMSIVWRSRDVKAKGSLWLRPGQKGYRLQTTGQAQLLDSYIESLCGPADGSAKAQVYQYWYAVSAARIEKVIDRLATLA
jgi:hypothetical protein